MGFGVYAHEWLGFGRIYAVCELKLIVYPSGTNTCMHKTIFIKANSTRGAAYGGSRGDIRVPPRNLLQGAATIKLRATWLSDKVVLQCARRQRPNECLRLAGARLHVADYLNKRQSHNEK